jgi:hypothetical protein
VICSRGRFDASDENWTLGQEKHRRKATIANTTGLRLLTAFTAAAQMQLMKLDLLFVAKRLTFFVRREPSHLVLLQ